MTLEHLLIGGAVIVTGGAVILMAVLFWLDRR